MRRILVVGITGAGKSTLARALGVRLGVPWYEMDALHFSGPGWAVDEEFGRKVAAIVEEDRWIFDSYGYPEVRDLLWERADTVVWLDYPRRVVMPRVLRRSLARTLTRRRIFGGNRERAVEWLSRDHPVLSSWSGHAGRRAEIGRRAGAPREVPLRVVRFDSPRQARLWLRDTGPRGTGNASGPADTRS
ncbi:adenylate kinase [Streptomyces sp. NBC_01218]|uniref:adenylate kinase n=1 Tax=unclassified Streptomyces TaxID=2593676 RepID=UPI0023B9832E|nr:MULTISPECIES: adenylate kinase [unclassified Streptomyces]WEH41692.1 adenylate kinase [Streptomyces sp. AM 2-1-1]WSQ53315.1 adenylate kinase [Streptomyces sp. NBC_01218]